MMAPATDTGADTGNGLPSTFPSAPFPSAEEAWFWLCRAMAAEVGGEEMRSAPCRPADMYRVIDDLRRRLKLTRDQMHVLVHYGRRLAAPDPERGREARAAGLWDEAFRVIRPALVARSWVVAERPGGPVECTSGIGAGGISR